MTRSDVVIIGGGFAGLSAAIYLARNRTRTVVVDSGRSMGVWEPAVQNYLGFPDGIPGTVLLEHGRRQVAAFGADLIRDEVVSVQVTADGADASERTTEFEATGEHGTYRARRLLLATGITHLPPEIPGVRDCLGKSLFFCKDCDAYRVQGGRVAIIGRNNEAVEYAVIMLRFAREVMISTNGQPPRWDDRRREWLSRSRLPVRTEPIVEVEHEAGRLRGLGLATGERLPVEFIFTTRGDVYHNALAKALGAALDDDGVIIVDQHMRTSVPGVYAAGCVTPANCQMIIAAGEGARAGQAINRDLFEDSMGGV